MARHKTLRTHSWITEGQKYWDSFAVRQLLRITTRDTINKHKKSLSLNSDRFDESQLWLLYLLNCWLQKGRECGRSSRHYSRDRFGKLLRTGMLERKLPQEGIDLEIAKTNFRRLICG